MYENSSHQVTLCLSALVAKKQSMPIVYFVDEILTPFVINDIKRIAEKVDTIYLFSVETLEGKDALPSNVVVFENFIDWENFKPLKIVFQNFWSILGIYLSECAALKKILPLKKSIALLASNIYKAECVRERLNGECSMLNGNQPSTIHHPPFTYYSFWFYDCIYLAWMKKKGWIQKAITRAHGGDLFEERGSLSGKIVFRHFQFKYLDKVLSVSQMGAKYLQEKYRDYSAKVETVYLGSTYQEKLNSFPISNEFVIVSCAKIRNIKRIHKIAEMLTHIQIPITWYHIGDENLHAKNDPTIPTYQAQKEKLKSNPNVQFVPLGIMDNQAVFEFYASTPTNLFISLSEAEGVPVSMMEAISFGIPILSTGVGGCREIVTEQTGMLIPLETSMEKVAQIVYEFKDSPKNTPEFRFGVRKFWEEHFDAEKNYKDLFEILGCE